MSQAKNDSFHYIAVGNKATFEALKKSTLDISAASAINGGFGVPCGTPDAKKSPELPLGFNNNEHGTLALKTTYC